ncbi:MAG: hypothetical protein K2M99_03265 [Treponemataceae bacterium]|nr:hypothetical protein [Treponemataceae bacterium]
MKKLLFTLFTLAALFCSVVTAQEQESQKTVAVVVPFDSSGVPQEEVDVVYRMFLSEFVRTGKCSVVDRSSFDKIKAQQNFQLSDWSNNDKVAKLGKALNANVVVTGQAMKFRAQVMLIVQILDVNSTEIISSSDERVGDVDELFNKFPAMCRELTKNLTKPQNAVAGNYDIGDFGPGGGYVFYYSEAGFPVYESDNASPVICHYLECSPVELGSITWCPCGNSKWCNVNTMDGVGAGKLNTRHILNSTHYNASSLTPSNCAAYACSRYFTGTTKEGEWYLPSKIELDLIYETLRKSGKIVSDSWHWSSLQLYSYSAWNQRFSDGVQYVYNLNKSTSLVVRAVRAF